jgi:hypothetical protein
MANPESFILFRDGMDRLGEHFPKQDQRFWRTIKASAKHIFDSGEPGYPAVVLMVGHKQDSELTTKMAKAVAVEFENSARGGRTDSVSDFTLDLAETTTSDSYAQKLSLDEWLKEEFDSGLNAVVLNHLELLQPQAALLLHGYCDGDNAPYKHAMMVLVLHLDKQVDSPRAAETALRDLWSSLTEDKLGALLTRIANNIVVVSSAE